MEVFWVMSGGEGLAQVAMRGHAGVMIGMETADRGGFGFDSPCRSWQTAAPIHIGTNSPEE